jgi:hypothetical protein
MTEPQYPSNYEPGYPPSQSAPPGWYPTGGGWQTYWDGLQWTQHQAPLHPDPRSGANDKSVALWAHLGSLLFGILVPIVIFAVKKDESPFVRHHALEAINFQLTMLIGYVVSIILIIVLIGLFTVLAVWILSIVLSIVAAAAANRGEWYRYPLTIRFFT